MGPRSLRRIVFLGLVGTISGLGVTPTTVSAGEKPVFVVATTAPEGDPWFEVARKSSDGHGDAEIVRFDPKKLGELIDALREKRARYVQFVVPPAVIDVNFCFELLEQATTVDADPFVDFAYGFITGKDPDAARRFLARSLELARSRKGVGRKILDNLGPNTQLPGTGALPFSGPHWTRFCAGQYQSFIFTHGRDGFHDQNLKLHEDSGIIHFGGHGEPTGITDGVSAAQVGRLKLRRAVVFNGACSTGVTSRYFDFLGPTVKVKSYEPADLFCLQLLDTGIVAYFAAVHPDHGIPVYQEMEYMLTTGASCGDTMKHTYDNVVMGSGGKRPRCPRLAEGKPFQERTPKAVMLYGTAARVLFGDPLARAVTKPVPGPFEVTPIPGPRGEHRFRVALVNPTVRYSLQDTFDSHLSANRQQFNDRIYVRIPLPAGVEALEEVSVVSARRAQEDLPHELMAHALEQLDGRTYLHVQVDFPTTGYQRSRMRSSQTVVTVAAR